MEPTTFARAEGDGEPRLYRAPPARRQPAQDPCFPHRAKGARSKRKLVPLAEEVNRDRRARRPARDVAATRRTLLAVLENLARTKRGPPRVAAAARSVDARARPARAEAEARWRRVSPAPSDCGFVTPGDDHGPPALSRWPAGTTTARARSRTAACGPRASTSTISTCTSRRRSSACCATANSTSPRCRCRRMRCRSRATTRRSSRSRSFRRGSSGSRASSCRRRAASASRAT